MRTFLLAVVTLICVLSGVSTGAEPVRTETRVATTAPETVRFAVLAFRAKAETAAKWQPLIDYLNTTLPERDFALDTLTYPELEQAVAEKRVDVVLTQPSHYILLAQRDGLLSPLATLVERDGSHKLSQFGGVMLARADRRDIETLEDLRSQRIATTQMSSLGSYQMQALELMYRGVILPDDAQIIETGQPQDRVIEAVLADKADVAFVRTGVLESMIEEGTLAPAQLKVINSVKTGEFPLAVSTRLYPEWPLAVMPWVEEELARRLAAALLALPHDGEVARKIGVTGFTIPLDYQPVAALLSDLRLPPYDKAPRFTLADVWAEYGWAIMGAGAAVVMISLLLVSVVRRQHQLKVTMKALDAAFQQRESLAKHVPGVIYQYRLRADGTAHFPYASTGIQDIYGVYPEEVVDDASPVFKAIHPEDAARVAERIRESANTLLGWRDQYRVNLPDGRMIWVEGEATPEAQGDGSICWHGYIRDITERMQVDDLLRHERRRLNDIVAGTHVGTWEWNVQTGETVFNERWAEIIGYRLEELEPVSIETWVRFTHPDDQTSSGELLKKHFDGDLPYYECEARMRHKDGYWVWVLDRGKVATWTDDGKPLLMSGTHQDITVRKQAEDALRLAANVFTHAREGIMITDADVNVIEINRAFSEITGYVREEVLGKNPRILNSGRQDKGFYAALWQALLSKGHWSGEVWNRRKDGHVYAEMLTITTVRDERGDTQNYIALFSDITQLKEHQTRLEQIAHYDALTGLPNRLLLADRLKQGMRQASRHAHHLAVVYLDLDGFKAVNDNYSHEVGDRLLITLAKRMSEALREGDTLARIGGDEFVAVLVDLPMTESCTPILDRLLKAAAESVSLGAIELHVSASIGASVYPQVEAVDADQLVRQADQAMYQAKQSGKNRYHIFDAEQDRGIRDHHESLRRIRQALANHEFVLHYQPKVNMRSGELLGAEALIRWQHPERGVLSPAAFLPAIENHPLSLEVGEWVIDTALTQIEAWHDEGMSIPVSVNVGSLQLQHPDFASRLHTLLSQHPGVKAGDLELEILETSALEDFAAVSRVMDTCQDMGVTFAVDDFGTGYSSLTYLKQLPVPVLKIDRSFVRDMLKDPDDLAILKGVLGLAEAFNRKVIAEGVETPDHGAALLRLGCTWGQGYAIARPMPAQDLPRWAMTWGQPPDWMEDVTAHPVGAAQ